MLRPNASTDRECVVASRELKAPLSFVPPQTYLTGAFRQFPGELTLAQREKGFKALWSPSPVEVSCGFLAPSAFDHAAEVVDDHASCPIVVVTANFGAYDRLVQPRHGESTCHSSSSSTTTTTDTASSTSTHLAAVPKTMEHCFYAFIDLSTKKQLRDDGECSCHFSSSTTPPPPPHHHLHHHHHHHHHYITTTTSPPRRSPLLHHKAQRARRQAAAAAPLPARQLLGVSTPTL